jgi:prevent-host-death family protein
MEYRVGLREANHHLARYVKAAEDGNDVVIMRRGQPVVRLVAAKGKGRVLSPAQKEAYQQMLELLEVGLPLEGVMPSKDQMHERD